MSLSPLLPPGGALEILVMGSCWVYRSSTWGSSGYLGERAKLSQDSLLSTAEEQVEIRSGFLAARKQLPVMVIITPQDRKNSIWTQDGPSPQVHSHLCPQMCGFLPGKKQA